MGGIEERPEISGNAIGAGEQDHFERQDERQNARQAKDDAAANDADCRRGRSAEQPKQDLTNPGDDLSGLRKESQMVTNVLADALISRSGAAA